MCFFGSYQRKTIIQIEAHLVAKYAAGAGTGTIAFIGAGIDDMLKEIEILLHGRKLRESDEP